MASSSCLSEYVSDITLCSICLEDFDDPRSLPCLHSFCLRCVTAHCQDKLPGDAARCPICREGFDIPQQGVDELRHNFFIQGLVEKKKAVLALSEAKYVTASGTGCERCGGNEIDARDFCVECRLKLCERCARGCLRSRPTPHSVIKLRTGVEPEFTSCRGQNCEIHIDEMVKMHCVGCGINICTVCFAVKHQGHTVREVDEFATELRGQMQEHLRALRRAVSDLNESFEKLNKRKAKFANDVTSVERAIVETGDNIKRLVDSEVGELLQKLQSVKMQTEKEMAANRDAIDMSLVAIVSFNNYTEQLVDKGSACDITRTAKELHKKVMELQKMPPKINRDLDFVTIPELSFQSSGTIANLKKEGAADKTLVGQLTVRDTYYGVSRRMKPMISSFARWWSEGAQ